MSLTLLQYVGSGLSSAMHQRCCNTSSTSEGCVGRSKGAWSALGLPSPLISGTAAPQSSLSACPFALAASCPARSTWRGPPGPLASRYEVCMPHISQTNTSIHRPGSLDMLTETGHLLGRARRMTRVPSARGTVPKRALPAHKLTSVPCAMCPCSSTLQAQSTGHSTRPRQAAATCTFIEPSSAQAVKL